MEFVLFGAGLLFVIAFFVFSFLLFRARRRSKQQGVAEGGVAVATASVELELGELFWIGAREDDHAAASRADRQPVAAGVHARRRRRRRASELVRAMAARARSAARAADVVAHHGPGDLQGLGQALTALEQSCAAGQTSLKQLALRVTRGATTCALRAGSAEAAFGHIIQRH